MERVRQFSMAAFFGAKEAGETGMVSMRHDAAHKFI